MTLPVVSKPGNDLAAWCGASCSARSCQDSEARRCCTSCSRVALCCSIVFVSSISETRFAVRPRFLPDRPAERLSLHAPLAPSGNALTIQGPLAEREQRYRLTLARVNRTFDALGSVARIPIGREGTWQQGIREL